MKMDIRKFSEVEMTVEWNGNIETFKLSKQSEVDIQQKGVFS